MSSTMTTTKIVPLNQISQSCSATNYRGTKEGQFFVTTLKRRFVFVRMKAPKTQSANEQLALF